MSKAEFLIAVFTFIGGFASALAAIEQQIIKKLLKKEATSEQKAVVLSKMRIIYRWRLNHLKKSGAIIEVDNGKYFYQESTYKKVLKKRVMAVLIISILLLVITIFYWQ